MDKERLHQAARDAYNKILDVTESNMDEVQMEDIIIELLKGYILQGFVEGWEGATDKATEKTNELDSSKIKVPNTFPFPWYPNTGKPFRPYTEPVIMMYGCGPVDFLPSDNTNWTIHTYEVPVADTKSNVAEYEDFVNRALGHPEEATLREDYTPRGVPTIPKGATVKVLQRNIGSNGLGLSADVMSWIEYYTVDDTTTWAASVPDKLLKYR